MLCNTCKSLDLSIEDFSIQADDDQDVFDIYHEIGSLELIREKSSICMLCRLTIQAIGGPPETSGQQEGKIQCQLYWQSDGFVWGEDEPKVRCLRVSCQPWPQSFNEYNRIIPLGDHLTGSQGLFLGREIKGRVIEIKRVKKWMKLCHRWHGDDCEQVSISPDPDYPANFRIIDSWNGCIVQTPPDGKFIALSYVWGPTKVFTLLKENLARLQMKGALREIWTYLPKIIQDAVTLTSSLGIRYIWIDSLCIVQDDPVDKISLIPYMRVIYDRAFVTLVAAAGGNAQAGLPGVCTSPRDRDQEKSGEISPGLRLICPGQFTDELTRSVYDSRAWTYQERYLSRRCLIFFENVVIFRCCCATWREDVYLESIEVLNNFDMTGKHGIRGTTATGEPHSDYVGSLYEYSCRQISYDSDVLHAFEGVLSVLSERMSDERNPGIEHAYGLPTVILDWAVLFVPNDSLRRRSNGSPSWSWCGWTGIVSQALARFSTNEIQCWLQDHTWIDWIIYDMDGLPLIQIPSRDTYQRNERYQMRFPRLKNLSSVSPASPTRVRQFALLNPSSFPPSATNPCSPLLHFATLSVFLTLVPATSEPHGPYGKRSARSYIICHPSTCKPLCPFGTMKLDSAWPFDPEPERTYEFLVLSDALRTQVVGKEFAARAFVSRSNDDVGSEWSAYFVMLIEKRSDFEEVAERVGLGVVYREVLDAALEEEGQALRMGWKEIWLR